MQDAEYFVAKAEECLRIVRKARENVDSLEGLANELMAKAVAIDTAQDRENTKNQKS